MPGIRGRYIRIYPKTWYSYIALRVELYGCCPKGLSLADIFKLNYSLIQRLGHYCVTKIWFYQTS